MCRFASFVLTKNNEYYLDISDSHEDIIDHYHLRDDNVNLVRVELIPPSNKEDILDVSKWEFDVDQDEYPDWTYPGDPTLEEKTRKALARRIEEQKIGETVTVGNYGKATVGNYGKATVGDNGQAIAGNYGKAIAGDNGQAIAGNNGKTTAGFNGKAIAGDDGQAIAGNFGIAIAGSYGKATVGNYGEAIAGYFGIAIAGDDGNATAGNYGKATVGNNGKILISWFDGNRNRTVIGYVGEDGILPNIFYKVENGKLVPHKTIQPLE